MEQVGLQPGAEEEPAAVRHDRRIAQDVLGHAVADGQHRYDGGAAAPGAPSPADHSQPELRERRVLPVRTAAAAPRLPADHHHPAGRARVPDHQAARVVAHAHRAPEHAAAEPVQVDTPDLRSGVAVIAAGIEDYKKNEKK